MSDKLLNKFQRINDNGVVFSKKEQEKEYNELMSELDNRINDLLHKIEFTNANPSEAFKIYMKLQSFLKKRRTLKNSCHIYVPRTETGNYIVNGKVKGKRKKYDNSKYEK